MSVWLENLKRLLKHKEVLIIHGNIRDSSYLLQAGQSVRGLSRLIRSVSEDLDFDRMIYWGVFFDKEKKGRTPMWSLERIEELKSSDSQQTGERPKDKTTGAQDREAAILHRWLSKDILDMEHKNVFVINYIDKITPYNERGVYPRDTALLVTLVQKLIEAIPRNNRLILVALKDTMVPLEYYTNSPKVAVMEIPLPDTAERKQHFSCRLEPVGFTADQISLMANITEGLYARDIENIIGDIREEANGQADGLSMSKLKAIVNRYRIGTEEDPWQRLPVNGPPKGLIDSAEAWFRNRVIGQDHAIHEVVMAVKKARSGITGLASGQEAKPKAIFFFAGASGTGKTFLAKNLADYLFDTLDAFVRFDMSEFKEEHTISKLIGSPPGYVGHERGGELTNAIKARPFTVVLFDEIEKAHPRIMDIFLQILDDGRLTDSRGQTVFFTESVIIFTSNIGTRTTDSLGRPSDEKDRLDRIKGIEDPEKRGIAIRAHFVESVRNFFIYEISRPELLNRIGSHIIAFNYLDDQRSQREIIKIKLEEYARAFRDKFAHMGYSLEYDSGVIEYLLERCEKTVREFGGRAVVDAINDEMGILADKKLIAEKDGLQNVVFYVRMNPQGELICVRRK